MTGVSSIATLPLVRLHRTGQVDRRVATDGCEDGDGHAMNDDQTWWQIAANVDNELGTQRWLKKQAFAGAVQ
jgi:hypothetical protein